MRTARVPGEGLDIAVREWPGDPDALPVVLLHGLTGSSADWEPVARELSPRCRVVALDARGHGASGWDPGEAYAGDAHFADVARALPALGIERCLVAGYSMGGGIAIIAGAALPDVVAGIVVVDTYPAPEMTPGSRAFAEYIAATWADDGAGAPFDPAIARKFARDLAAGNDRRLDLWPLWDALTCPVLLVRGALSDVLPAVLAAEMAARQPRCELVTLPGVGHQVPFHRPRDLARLVAAFAERAP